MLASEVIVLRPGKELSELARDLWKRTRRGFKAQVRGKREGNNLKGDLK